MTKRIEVDSSKIKAKYKIEIHFGSERSVHQAKGIFTCWESGKALNGDGDVQMIFCGYDENSASPCGKPFSVDCISSPFAVCPHCQRKMWASEMDYRDHGKLTNEKMPWAHNLRIFPRMPTRWIAERLTWYFQILEGDADIYLKYHPLDIRVAQMKKDQGPDAARRLRGLVVYPLNRILADTATGADLEGRFKALVTA